MSDNGPPAFADDLRMRHLFLITNLPDVKNDVVGVLLQGVIGRTVKGRPASIVIDTQTAADIQRLDDKTHLAKLGVKARRLLHGLFNGKDVRHLRADVEMKQAEAMLHFFRAQNLRRRHQLGRVQPELGVFPATVGPFARPFARQPHADSEHRLHAHLTRDRDDVPQLLQLLDHHHHFLAQLDAHQRHADEQSIFVAVADNQAARLVLKRQAGEQLGLAPNLQAELVRLARVQDFLHHFAQLVDLDGKDAAVMVLIIELRDGRGEGLVDGLDTVAQNILEPEQHRKLQPATLGLLNHVGQIHHRPILPQRHGHDVSGIIDVEVLRSPTIDVVQSARRLDIPGGRRRSNLAHFDFKICCALYEDWRGIQ